MAIVGMDPFVGRPSDLSDPIAIKAANFGLTCDSPTPAGAGSQAEVLSRWDLFHSSPASRSAFIMSLASAMDKCIFRQVPSPVGGACPLQSKQSLQKVFQSARMAKAGLLGEMALEP